MTDAAATRRDGETAEQQAHILAQALPFLRRYAGATIVVKYGGHAMGEEHLAAAVRRDIALLKQVGVNPVVVHGGGPQINAMLKRLAITVHLRRRAARHRRGDGRGGGDGARRHREQTGRRPDQPAPARWRSASAARTAA